MSKSKKILTRALVLVLLLCFSLTMLTNSFAGQPVKDLNKYNGKIPKYVFLFIGDGMSFPQVSSAEMYLGKKADPKNIGIKKLNMSQFPVAGISTTYDAESFIPDSASTGTAISTGNKTLGGVIGMDVTKKIKYPNIAEYAKMFGYKVGIVSSVSIDHATPAVFYAHQPSRNNYYDIAVELANSSFDYFGGGGFKQPTGAKNDQKNVIDIAKANGFKVLTTKDEIIKADASYGRVIATNPTLDADMALPYDIDRKSDDLALADYVKKGIEVLDNPKGFFMMCEGGKIDWACHANDAGATINDVLALDNAVAEAKKFYDKHPDETLIVCTADHETGGLTIGFAATGYSTFFDKIGYQTKSFLEFDKILSNYRKTHTKDNAKLEDLYADIKTSFGLLSPSDADAATKKDMVLSDYEIQKLKDSLAQSILEAKDRKFNDNDKLLYGTYDPFSVTLTHILNNKAGLGWTTYSHSGLPVPVYAIGNGQDLFAGYYDDTDIYKKLVSILGMDKDKTAYMKIEANGAKIVDDKLMLPLLSVAALVKGTVETYSGDGKYIIKINGNTIEMYVGKADIVVNGGSYKLSTVATSDNGTVMVPAELLEYAGCKFTADTAAGTVRIKY